MYVDALKRVLLAVWKVTSCEIMVLCTNKLLFIFGWDKDKTMVLMGEPWTFNVHLIALCNIDTPILITKVEFNEVSLCIQLHDLQLGCMMKEVGLTVGACIGKVFPTSNSLCLD